MNWRFNDVNLIIPECADVVRFETGNIFSNQVLCNARFRVRTVRFLMAIDQTPSSLLVLFTAEILGRRGRMRRFQAAL